MTPGSWPSVKDLHLESRVVYEDVDPAVLLDGLVDDALAVRLAGDVPWQRQEASANEPQANSWLQLSWTLQAHSVPGSRRQ